MGRLGVGTDTRSQCQRGGFPYPVGASSTSSHAQGPAAAEKPIVQQRFRAGTFYGREQRNQLIINGKVPKQGEETQSRRRKRSDAEEHGDAIKEALIFLGPNAKIKEIAAWTGLSRKTVGKHLRKWELSN